MYPISFANADIPSSLRHKIQLRLFIEEIFRLEAKKLYTLQYILCSDSYLLKINNQFLNHDEYTDIITFDLSESDRIEGEVYISTERVRENAIDFGTGFQEELQRVVFHGALHLCGYRDKKKSEIEAMRYKEDHYLRLFKKWKKSLKTK